MCLLYQLIVHWPRNWKLYLLLDHQCQEIREKPLRQIRLHQHWRKILRKELLWWEKLNWFMKSERQRKNYIEDNKSQPTEVQSLIKQKIWIKFKFSHHWTKIVLFLDILRTHHSLYWVPLMEAKIKKNTSLHQNKLMKLRNLKVITILYPVKNFLAVEMNVNSTKQCQMLKASHWMNSNQFLSHKLKSKLIIVKRVDNLAKQLSTLLNWTRMQRFRQLRRLMSCSRIYLCSHRMLM